MKNKLFFLSFFMFISTCLFAQQNQTGLDKKEENKKNIENFKQLRNELDGIYQIQMIDTRYDAIISMDLLNEIKKRRLPNEEVKFNFQKNMRILILPLNTSRKFNQTEQVIFVNE
jgi:hypothetical protein